jgi:pimeloyl-ACP methyl ester carboxylesterase
MGWIAINIASRLTYLNRLGESDAHAILLAMHREYGIAGPQVVVLHGGPAASGDAGPLARGLSDRFRVLEPWQRGSGETPLTVARHIEDLRIIIQDRCPGAAPGIVGESWGAMFALAFAAAHPRDVGPLVLVGCGTFTIDARRQLLKTLEERRAAGLTDRLYDFDAEPRDPNAEGVFSFDAKAHDETWNDMIRLQNEGIYPAAFSAIVSPVLMLHGAYDPHPGSMIRDSLLPHLPQIEYREWERCGHSPWRERSVRDEFFQTLGDWLARSSNP